MKEQTDRCTERLQAAKENRRMSEERTLWRYLRVRLRDATLYGVASRCVTYFRRFRLFALLWRVTQTLFLVLQTGTAVLLSTVLLLIVLPLVFALCAGILITAISEAGRVRKLLSKETENRRVHVLFLPPIITPYFRFLVDDLVRREDATVLLVCCEWFSRRGLRDGHFYCSVRKEAPHVFLVRRYCFFNIKRHVLQKRNTVFWF